MACIVVVAQVVIMLADLSSVHIPWQEAQATLCAVFAYHVQHPSDQQPQVSRCPLASNSAGRMTVDGHMALLQASRQACGQMAVRAHTFLTAVYSNR